MNRDIGVRVVGIVVALGAENAASRGDMISAWYCVAVLFLLFLLTPDIEDGAE